MAKSDIKLSWAKHFGIQSEVDLDFVIGQKIGWPVGMQRRSPAEFRRRILAAAVSYHADLQSVDYALKRYVDPNQYEDEGVLLGDVVSDYLAESVAKLMDELLKLHTAQPSFGEFGSEITLYRLPHALDVARMLSNRGLLLEVLPVLRLCIEMTAWANVAFHFKEEDRVIKLKAQTCISELKATYSTAGKLYGYLSTFSHWSQVIHGHFLDFNSKGVGVLRASVRYRAVGLALCLVVLDIIVEVVKRLYRERAEALSSSIRGIVGTEDVSKILLMLSEIAELTDLDDVREVYSFIKGA